MATKDEKKLAKSVLTDEIGASGTVIVGGIISEDDYNSDLQGESLIRNVDEMRKGDATVRAASLAVKLPVISAKWFLEPASEEKEDMRAYEFVKKNLFEDMTITWQDFIREALLFLDYGHYAFEQVYENNYFEGQLYIGLRKLAARLPATIWAWTTSDGSNGIRQYTMEKGYVDIPIEKLLILTNEQEGDNRKGTTIFRSAFKPWYIKDNLYKIDAIAHERQGLGIPYVKKPDTGVSKKDENKAKQVLENIRANQKGHLVIPNGWEVGFLDMKAGGIKDATKSIQHHDRQIVKSVLAQFLELGATSTGSYALSADQSDLFLLSLQAVAQQLRDAIQKYVIDRLVDLNFDVERAPQLHYEKIGAVDYNALSTALQRVAQVGMIMPDEDIERYLRNAMGLPEKAEESDLPADFGQDILDDLETEFATFEGEIGATADSGDQPPDITDGDIQQASEIMFGATRGPLSEEHKQKIREALQRYWSSRKKGPKSKSGRKSGSKTNPAVKAKNAEVKALRDEMSAFRDQIKREILERKAKGEKITPEESAKLQLQLLDKKEEISSKINALRAEIDAIKGESVASKATEFVKNRFIQFATDFRNALRGVTDNE